MQERQELEELELDLLLTGVAQRWGYDFRNYTEASLRRRVQRAMQLEGVRTISALQERLLRDPQSFQRFVSTLTIKVTGMFRDAEVYRALRKQVVPALRTWPFLRIWVAGCATGEEVYSLAILLREEGLLERSRIYATDLSEDVLRQARRGIYPLAAMREYTRAYQLAGGEADFSSYYRADDRNAILRPELSGNIIFSQHNLVSDGSFNEFHLILCRNVMIYFDAELRQRVYELLHDSLVKFGILVLGIRESLRFAPNADQFEPLSEPLRIYRRVR
ncbi:MAG TPA: protein-glutamate O-methyltransferase CheR [Thermoanaerobaculia bacterium]|nr:protein-glutamate O-methyltransferase CheR [Thermoanaerobaculia bacterium]